jgi:hypothetical protein
MHLSSGRIPDFSFPFTIPSWSITNRPKAKRGHECAFIRGPAAGYAQGRVALRRALLYQHRVQDRGNDKATPPSVSLDGAWLDKDDSATEATGTVGGVCQDPGISEPVH